MADFRKNFKGQIWLEVFVVKGLNDSADEMRKLRSAIRKIKPDKIQLNTSVRLPNKKYSASIQASELLRLASMLGKHAEVIAAYSLNRPAKKRIPSESEVLGFLRRRPATADEIATGLRVGGEHAHKILRAMRAAGSIASRRWAEREVFYVKK
jgi:wyosine [tRNA(Phe)-imidazoG37] synthetase (radical SAM superfamily)